MPKSPHSVSIERIATEIGYISIYWAWLEDVVDELVTVLAPLEPGQPAEAITGNADLRQKIQMIKALAFLRRGEHEDWYKSLLDNLNSIDNDLRGRRNTFVHSAWYTPNGRLQRHKKTIRLSKPQAFQAAILTTKETRPIKIGEARKLRKEILRATKTATYHLSFAMYFELYASRKISFSRFLREAVPLVHRTRKPQERRLLPQPSED